MNVPSKPKLAAAVVAVAALAGGGAAIAATQGAGSPGEESQAIIDDAAADLGVSPAKLAGALKQALVDQLEDQVAAGTLTQEQADAMKERIQSEDFPILGGLHGGGPGHHGGFADLDAAATYLGLTATELRTDLDSGKTLAEIATADGKSVDGLVQALVSSAKERLATDVAAGRLTQAQADEMSADLEQRITGMVNGELPSFGGPPPGFDGAPPSSPTGADAAA